jgi:hypothetical protein
MTHSEQTQSVLVQLEEYSKHSLRCSGNIAFLIETAHTHQLFQLFDEISFHAKALLNIFQLMKKIGKHDDGYQKLSAEFSNQLTMLKMQLHKMTKNGDDELRRVFRKTFLQQTQESLQQLMFLCEDLRTYKNWKIDTNG